MTANPQRIPAISAYPKDGKWRVRVDLTADITTDDNQSPCVDAGGNTPELAREDAVEKLKNIAIHALQQINHLTKAQ